MIPCWKPCAPTEAVLQISASEPPLLSGKEDCQQVIDALTGHYDGLGSQNALVFMGHGTAHHADFAYPALDYMCKASGHANIHIATVEGYPTLEEVKASLRIQKPKQVILAPLMLVAGDHAANDMAGDNDDSWEKPARTRRLFCFLPPGGTWGIPGNPSFVPGTPEKRKNAINETAK